MSCRRICIVLASSAALVFGGATASAAGHASAQWSDDEPQLLVDVVDDEYPALEIELDGLTRTGFPGRMTLEVPTGFELYPDRPAGSLVGNGVIFAADESYGSSTVSSLAGQIVAEPVDAAAEAAAQACSPGKHVAIWSLDLSLLGQPLELPIYVSDAGEGSPGDSRFKLDLCAPPVVTAGPALPILSIQLLLPDLGAPSAKGAYMWHAIVTPLAPDRHTLLPGKAYELRALVPVPHALTLRGSYDRRSHTAVLRGRLTAAGKPRGGIRVSFIGLVRAVTADGIVIRDAPAGSTRTTASGTFVFRKRIRRTTGFLAFVRSTTGACTGTALAPGGCTSTTTAPTRSDTVTVSVPRP